MLHRSALAVRGALGFATAIGMVATLAGCATTAPAAGSDRISVSSEACGTGWSDPRAGQQTFVITNRDIVAGEVYLADAGTHAVYAYVDDVAPNATAELRIDLGSGRYAFLCAMSDRSVTAGKTVTVPGHAKGTRPVRPVSQNDLVPATKAYHTYVASALPGLEAQAQRLADDIHSGNLGQARADWLPAHLAYERLGAAYNAFGAADAAINGLSAGLPQGVSDPDFTGFHRIEYGLWHDQSTAVLTPLADELVTDIAKLASDFASEEVEPLDLSIRAHEIAENALQFELTGQSDYGSGTSLASVGAELDGTKVVLDILKPVLGPRYPDLARVYRELATASADVDALQNASAPQGARAAQPVDGWPPLTSLTTAERERINSDLSGLTGLLAPVASICEPRRTS
ncbi:MAG: EfeM/EfeO family lipoprotein [Galbitalea sp.]